MLKPRTQTLIAAIGVLALAGQAAADRAGTDRSLQFDPLDDGRVVIVADLHTHTVFSDGHVWPNVRIWEAERDGLDAIAITDHLEHQPRRDDIPHPDRNRPYEIARDAAERSGSDLIVINGVEITRRLTPGHVVAFFIEDANPLLTIDDRADDNPENGREALEIAREQGAFTFWAHPSWPRDAPDGLLTVPAEQQALIEEGLILGAEVANGRFLSEEVLQFALDNDLAVIGATDIHGLIDYDYDIAAGQHRTVTLVLADEKTPEAMKAALEANQSVALYQNRIVGPEEHVRALIASSLTVEAGEHRRNSTILQVTVRNSAPVPIMVENIGERHFSNNADIFTIPARGEVSLNLTDTPDSADFVIPLRILSSLIGARENLEFDLAP